MTGLMEDTFDVAEPPRLCPVDVPVLFDPRSNASAKPNGNPGRGEADGEDGVCRELDACLSVLEGLKPEVRRMHNKSLFMLVDILLAVWRNCLFRTPTVSSLGCDRRLLHCLIETPDGNPDRRERGFRSWERAERASMGSEGPEARGGKGGGESPLPLSGPV